MAQTNIYLKLGDIKGESLDEKYEEWIEIDTVAWRADNKASYKIGDPGKAKGGKSQAEISNITVTKPCDLSSVTLMQNCVLGSGIAKGTISFLKLDGETRVEYFKIELKKIMVSSVAYTGAGATEDLKETIELKFTEFKETYKLQRNDTGLAGGYVPFGWWDNETHKLT